MINGNHSLAMAFHDLFSEHAGLYALARPQYPDELFEWLASQTPSLQCAWDCGTGNGQAAISLARYFKRVEATGPSADQIAQARRVMNVTYRVEPAESTTLPDRSADAVCVAQALHWFDFPAFFAEVGRVAKPGALLAAWGYNWFSVSEEFDSEFRRAILDTIHPYWAPQNQLLWDRYVNVPCPFPRMATPEFRISAQWNLGQLMAFVRTWSATRRCLSAKGDAFLESAVERLRTAWGISESTRTIIMPLHLLAARLP